ncbi:cyclin-like protein [Rhypophila decipiens]|uniref:Cyclin-like protein n=1 Tax=Rhypophila decipiens TaxID=261697 RepID=A0AAN6YMJ9_9PEZI|nr:cyclin-like protein [Rhypophila decipiens]
MDAKPQRLARAVPSAFYGSENGPSQKAGVHQRHRSAGNLKAMAGSSSTLNAPPKRSAFGDLSNTARPLAGEGGVKEIPKPRVKSAIAVVNARDARVLEEKENPSRAVPNNSSKYLSSAPISNASSYQASKPVPRVGGLSTVKQGLVKKPTAIYSDNKFKGTAVRSQPGVSVDDNASLADKEVKVPRHYKSQPQLKTTQPALRRTQSRYLTKSEKLAEIDDEEDVDDNATEAPYEDAVEQFSNDYEPSVEDQIFVKNEEFHDTDLELETRYTELAHTKLYNGAMSEPEEYWDEDDEEQDLYDDQGYTTAHSYRSHGDNTTGGVTCLLAPKVTSVVLQELEAARLYVLANVTEEEEQEEQWDTSLVAEYGEEIFVYMRQLETQYLPNPYYMDIQTEIQWSMRSVLMDWVVQVHTRFHLLPETLFLTVNYIDRFLSVKVVSLAKLQLVGATAVLIAAKVEEVTCPSVQEIVYMVDKGFTCDEILKAERFMLSMLQFEMNWPGPMSFLRRISKGDEYDLETRTLAKYFLEVTIMDERFVGSPASYLAAGAHCLSRMILNKGDWTPAHVHWSGYTLGQLRPLIMTIFECCQEPRRHHQAVYDKYSSAKYQRSSTYVEAAIQNGWEPAFPPSQPRLQGSF